MAQPAAAAAADLPIESIPANVSVWEAATFGRQIILDKSEVHDTAAAALDAQKAKVAASDALKPKDGKQPKKEVLAKLYQPVTMEAASRDQPEYVDEGMKFLDKEILDEYAKRLGTGIPLGSSLPHLTPGVDGGRAAHVTSSRVVGKKGEFVIHERFHQDQGPRAKSEPSHDRFFATDGNGRVYTVTPTFNGSEDAKKAAALYQATVEPPRKEGARPLLHSTVMDLVVWSVDSRVTNDVPLSPRSRRRELPDTGYGVAKAHK